ncbi:MAG: M4 family metallopeptidase [Myxococcales bacterium]
MTITVKTGCHSCFIIPPSVLQALERDASLQAQTRDALNRSFAETNRLRAIREGHRQSLLGRRRFLQSVVAAEPPQQQLYDCRHRTHLPGRLAPNPAQSSDAGIKAVYAATQGVISFYSTVLNRSSIDDQGMDVLSSLHYGKDYQNAFWNGSQMVYGDGDGQIFKPFYLSPDVIGHELTHGVTQYLSGLAYEREAGGLNESISDVFGAVFNQQFNNLPASDAKGWLIGAGIMGPLATSKGKTCLRDMLAPSASHCLSPQPDTYSQIDPMDDPHDTSGVPNKAFAKFAQALGGNSWDVAIKVWYDACRNPLLTSNATFAQFASLTASAAKERNVLQQLVGAWETVGVNALQL